MQGAEGEEGAARRELLDLQGGGATTSKRPSTAHEVWENLAAPFAAWISTIGLVAGLVALVWYFGGSLLCPALFLVALGISLLDLVTTGGGVLYAFVAVVSFVVLYPTTRALHLLGLRTPPARRRQADLDHATDALRQATRRHRIAGEHWESLRLHLDALDRRLADLTARSPLVRGGNSEHGEGSL